MTIQTHIARRDNPHQLTLAQIGLGNLKPFALATEADIIGLTKADVYIGANSTTTIGLAFRNYLDSLGLIVNNKLVPPAISSSGTVTFVITSVESWLNGSHPTAKNITVKLYANGVLDTQTYQVVVNSGTDVPTYWHIDTTTLTFTPGVIYSVRVEYRTLENASLGISNKTATVVDLGSYSFTTDEGTRYIDSRDATKLTSTDLIYIDLNEPEYRV